MKTKLIVRYVSGRVEEFEVELFGGPSAEARLKEFAKDPTIVLQTEKEVVIIKCPNCGTSNRFEVPRK